MSLSATDGTRVGESRVETKRCVQMLCGGGVGSVPLGLHVMCESSLAVFH